MSILVINKHIKDYEKIITLISLLVIISSKAFCQEARVSDSICSHPELMANMPGGEPTFKRFISKNLNTNIPIKNKAPKGAYTVIVKFIVDVDGKVSDVTAETNFGYGMEDEAIGVIKLSSPHWVPALCNGKNAKAYRRAAINFTVE